jgi:uncharacterized protein (TIGR03083 family)
MAPEAGDAHLHAYIAVQLRLDDLVRGRRGAEAVPACPAWTVRDVVAHLVGLCEDWVDHRLDGYATAAWTAAQVTRADGQDVDAILDRWVAAMAAFVELEDDPAMGPPGRWAVGDAFTHEADIRGSLGVERVPADAVALGLKGSIARWREVLGAASMPTLLVRAPDLREWWIGTPDDPGAVVVDVPAYELFRALAGRRTQEQVRAWAWSRDPTPYLAAGLPYPFRFAESTLVD